MYLQQILNGVAYQKVGEGNFDITSLACDTSEVRSGCLFFCLKGSRRDGHDFFRKAIGDGAVALVTERKLDTAALQFVVPDARAAMAICARNFYENACDKMKLVYVVGTNGKTSTTYLLDAIFRAAGYNTGVIGTNGVFFAGKKHASHLTTPDPIELHGWLKQMYLNKVRYVFIEASAHAIALRKLVGMRAEVAVFTNFSRDHLDYFGTMDNYKRVKLSLFCPQYVTNAVVNIDDPVGKEILPLVPSVTYSVCGARADVSASEVCVADEGTTFVADCLGKKAVVHLSLSGRFNVYNALAALSVASVCGVDLGIAVAALEDVDRIDGRNETITSSDGRRIVVDFAHTPDGIDNILSHLRKTTVGKLIVVFGCGGNRDKLKRPLMAQAVSKYADFAVLTNDNPRYEDPSEIVADALGGLTCPHKVVLNRATATRLALDNAKCGDTVAILGKGAECYQDTRGRKVPYSDCDTVRRILAEQTIKTQ